MRRFLIAHRDAAALVHLAIRLALHEDAQTFAGPVQIGLLGGDDV